jgi:hypothetical protein
MTNIQEELIPLIKRLQADIIDHNIPLSSILLTAKILAHHLKNEELKRWVKSEMDGYTDQALLPDYRIFQTAPIATTSNGAWRRTGDLIPTFIFPEDLQERLCNCKIGEGIFSLEEYSKRPDGVKLQFSGNVISLADRYFSQANDGYYHIEELHQYVSSATFGQILATSRSRLQDFILELSSVSWDVDRRVIQDNIQRLVEVTIFNHASGGTMTNFDQKNQNVGTQYNAGRDINVGSVNSLPDLIDLLQTIKGQVSNLGGVKDIGNDVVIEAEYEIEGAIKEAKKTEPNKTTIQTHIGKAKDLFGDIAAAGGVVTALVKAAEALQGLL